MNAGIPAAVSAADLQFALQSLEEVGQVSVTREGGCAGYSWRVKWRSTCGKQPLLQVPSHHLGFVFFCVFFASLHPASCQRDLETLCILKVQMIDQTFKEFLSIPFHKRKLRERRLFKIKLTRYSLLWRTAVGALCLTSYGGRSEIYGIEDP